MVCAFTLYYRHDPPHALHGTPPSSIASLLVILMQFFVQRRARMQLGQWYFRESLLKATKSAAAEEWIDTARINPATMMVAAMTCRDERRRLQGSIPINDPHWNSGIAMKIGNGLSCICGLKFY
jgi:hypothetical protein